MNRGSQATVVSGRWLEERLAERTLRVVDVRSDARERPSGPRLREEREEVRFIEHPEGSWRRIGRSSATSRSPRCYLDGHVPGAVSLDVAGRLFGDDGLVVCAPELAMAMSEIGVGDEHTVVLVGNNDTTMARVAGWALAHYGHPEVHLLDGGFARWMNEGRRIARDAVHLPPASFTARVAPPSRTGRLRRVG